MMDMLEAVQTRHSVRAYLDKPITGEVLKTLQAELEACNLAGGLNMQLVVNEPNAFSVFKARMGKFKNVRNYIALVGPKEAGLAEKCGYYGEKLVLKAQQLGLNTCWVGLTYSKGKSAVKVKANEKLLLVIAIGYGVTAGSGHKVKTIEQLSLVKGPVPKWFENGMRAAQLAPTALNQQKFIFELLEGDKVKATPGLGFYTKVDMGIAKCHFEIGAGEGDWQWL